MSYGSPSVILLSTAAPRHTAFGDIACVPLGLRPVAADTTGVFGLMCWCDLLSIGEDGGVRLKSNVDSDGFGERGVPSCEEGTKGTGVVEPLTNRMAVSVRESSSQSAEWAGASSWRARYGETGMPFSNGVDELFGRGDLWRKGDNGGKSIPSSKATGGPE